MARIGDSVTDQRTDSGTIAVDGLGNASVTDNFEDVEIDTGSDDDTGVGSYAAATDAGTENDSDDSGYNSTVTQSGLVTTSPGGTGGTENVSFTGTSSETTTESNIGNYVGAAGNYTAGDTSTEGENYSQSGVVTFTPDGPTTSVMYVTDVIAATDNDANTSSEIDSHGGPFSDGDGDHESQTLTLNLTISSANGALTTTGSSDLSFTGGPYSYFSDSGTYSPGPGVTVVYNASSSDSAIVTKGDIGGPIDETDGADAAGDPVGGDTDSGTITDDETDAGGFNEGLTSYYTTVSNGVTKTGVSIVSDSDSDLAYDTDAGSYSDTPSPYGGQNDNETDNLGDDDKNVFTSNSSDIGTLVQGLKTGSYNESQSITDTDHDVSGDVETSVTGAVGSETDGLTDTDTDTYSYGWTYDESGSIGDFQDEAPGAGDSNLPLMPVEFSGVSGSTTYTLSQSDNGKDITSDSDSESQANGADLGDNDSDSENDQDHWNETESYSAVESVGQAPSPGESGSGGLSIAPGSATSWLAGTASGSSNDHEDQTYIEGDQYADGVYLSGGGGLSVGTGGGNYTYTDDETAGGSTNDSFNAGYYRANSAGDQMVSAAATASSGSVQNSSNKYSETSVYTTSGDGDESYAAAPTITESQNEHDTNNAWQSQSGAIAYSTDSLMNSFNYSNNNGTHSFTSGIDSSTDTSWGTTATNNGMFQTYGPSFTKGGSASYSGESHSVNQQTWQGTTGTAVIESDADGSWDNYSINGAEGTHQHINGVPVTTTQTVGFTVSGTGQERTFELDSPVIMPTVEQDLPPAANVQYPEPSDPPPDGIWAAFVSGLGTGAKALVNSTVKNVVSTATLGWVEVGNTLPVTKQDMNNGYATVSVIADVSVGIALSLAGNPACAVAQLGTVGKAVSLGMRAAEFGKGALDTAQAGRDVYQNGLSISNGLQFVGGSMQMLSAYQGGCFLAGTLVHTQFGPQPIEGLCVGDNVWACDLHTGQWRLCPVVTCFEDRYLGPLAEIKIAGETISVTYHHPFWVVDGEDLAERPKPDHLRTISDPFNMVLGRWVDAGDLRPGDVLLVKPDQRARVEAVDIRDVDAMIFNVQVHDLHNYAIGNGGVLAHNMCAKAADDPPGAPSRPPNLAPTGAGRRGAFNQAKRDAGIPTSMQPSSTRIIPDRTNPGKTVVEYEYAIPKPGGGSQKIKLRDDRNGHFYPDDPSQNRGPHFNGPENSHYDYW